MPSPIVHINGFPGTGKLTVARRLAEKLSALNARLVHNYLLIDPAGAILPRSSVDYQPLRHAIRAAVFATLIQSRDTFDSLYIFTDFQSSDELGSSVVAEYECAAKRRNCAFIPVILSCAKEENLRRLTSEERTLHGKLTACALVSQMHDRDEVHRFAKHPFQLDLDITNLEPDLAADLICRHILGICMLPQDLDVR